MQSMTAEKRRKKPPDTGRPRGSVVDLFCGAGGLTHGFRLEGFRVVAGYDVDEHCRYPYERNNSAPFIRKDVEQVKADEIARLFLRDEPRILVGCAPCQPFSTYNQKNEDPKWRLVSRFADLIAEIRPDVISMENVPRLFKFRGGRVFGEFTDRLRSAGYSVHHRVVFLPEHGLAQQRSRLVLLASRHGAIELEAADTPPDRYATVEGVIGDLPPLAAGEHDPLDPLHSASRLSERNLRRIRASKPGGSWRDWDPDLVAPCHRSETGKGYGSVYGRMSAELPSPTITTQFYGFGSGRFGHPTQDRALSLREGAILQSFPRTYEFHEPGSHVGFKQLGRMIGNAVPVVLGRVIARSIDAHLRKAAA